MPQVKSVKIKISRAKKPKQAATATATATTCSSGGLSVRPAENKCRLSSFVSRAPTGPAKFHTGRTTDTAVKFFQPDFDHLFEGF